ncbi:OLC1v1032236C1 [Oldenlandia corymbosa var. corymbosa]|uniref:OLC1v1032236C1 n=1 Tax=Oldenlandia corymbosa var. corymbosa TaxID=529605 RepID=A0AAV1CLZ6_OLDCO|nr:OLC1v1032236C1 [Oldenlandia corymbosa var. corymbosa]
MAAAAPNHYPQIGPNSIIPHTYLKPTNNSSLFRFTYRPRPCSSLDSQTQRFNLSDGNTSNRPRLMSLTVRSTVDLRARPTGGIISETFSRLKEQGQIALAHLPSKDKDPSTTVAALKCLGATHSDAWDDDPDTQDALAAGATKNDTVLSMRKSTGSQFICPIATLIYYNERLKCGVEKLMATVRDVKEQGKKKLPLILGSVGAGCVLFMLANGSYKKGIYNYAHFPSWNSSGIEFEDESVDLGGVRIFSVSELKKATNNFDPTTKLGSGGFGAVYLGILPDGTEVAVKCLYRHHKQEEQCMNEVALLTPLTHPNLVTLYGRTSRRSGKLLLVYQYVPNGTLADHLHGDRANDKHLTWDLRMKIAIETAEALAYLHAWGIIHRDVKTNNILLDHNFCVKVADFGLCRLIPAEATHVFTAPQGTPAYIDPEYCQSWQLGNKSDVYSFGVVLAELISSMPAFDRRRPETLLANLAVDRIQKCAFDDLIDPSLGYKTDAEVLRMTTSVAELAFRCLQLEKEMRPTMEEVLESLKEIQNLKQI